MSFLTLQNAHIFDVIGTYEYRAGAGYGKLTRVNYVLDKLPLKVVMGSIEVTPNINIKVTDLNKKGGVQYKHFFNQSDSGVTFKCDVIIGKNDMWHSESWGIYKLETSKEYKEQLKKGVASRNYDSDFKVIDVLKNWIENMYPVKVVTQAIDIPNGTYIISKNSSRKQDNHLHTVWSLEFTTFNPLTLPLYKTSTANIKKAIKIANNKKKTGKSSSAYKSKLKKCKLTNLKYTKKKKTSVCVKYMQMVLYKTHFLNSKSLIDGWYGKTTYGAVKKFQEKYKKKYKLKPTGKMDSATLNAMCKV